MIKQSHTLLAFVSEEQNIALHLAASSRPMSRLSSRGADLVDIACIFRKVMYAFITWLMFDFGQLLSSAKAKLGDSINILHHFGTIFGQLLHIPIMLLLYLLAVFHLSSWLLVAPKW